MAFHFIAILSHYAEGRRIGWHYASEEQLDPEIIQGFLDSVERECGNVQLGIHKLSTTDVSWESVVNKDSFFADVFVTEDVERLVAQISADQELSVYDVAKFILSLVPSSHLKLQKLLYYAYADFLLLTGKKLFKEPIVAYNYGPVVEDIFHRYKVHGSSTIDFEEDASFCIKTDEMILTPSCMKMIASEHGAIAAKSVLDTLKKYKDFGAFELVDKTHETGGPWHKVFIPGANSVITDELIQKYHKVTA